MPLSQEDLHVDQPAPVPARRSRDWGARATRFEVSVQPVGGRSATCKVCGDTFLGNAPRICTWGERAASRYVHLACSGYRLQRECQVDAREGTPPEVLQQVLAFKNAPADPGEVACDVLVEAAEERDTNGFEAFVFPRGAAFAAIPASSWDALDTPTWVQVPKRWQKPLLDLRKQVLTNIEATRGTEVEVHAWRLFLVMDQLLLGARAEPSEDQEDTCGAALAYRSPLFLEGSWDLLLADQRYEGRRPVYLRPPASVKASRLADRVRTLASNGELGRALGAVVAAPLAPRDASTVAALVPLFPRASPGDVLPDDAYMADDSFTTAFVGAADRVLRRTPRLAAPGLWGTRAEHWQPVLRDATARPQYLRILQRLALGNLPPAALLAFAACKVVALQKATPGSVRPLQLGNVHRRHAHKVLMHACKHDLAEGAGPDQYGLGRANGMEQMVCSIKAIAEIHPGCAALALDTEAAF